MGHPGDANKRSRSGNRVQIRVFVSVVCSSELDERDRWVGLGGGAGPRSRLHQQTWLSCLFAISFALKRRNWKRQQD